MYQCVHHKVVVCLYSYIHGKFKVGYNVIRVHNGS